MSMSNPYEYTPSILTNILARRKADERQTMLDDLTKRQQEASIEATKERMSYEKTWREGQAQADKARAFKDWAEIMGPGANLTPDMETYLKESNAGGLIEEGKTPTMKTTIWGPGPAPEYGEDFVGPHAEEGEPVAQETETPIGPKGPSTFKGTWKQQQDQQEKDFVTGIKNDPDFLKLPKLQQLLTLQQMGISNPEKFLELSEPDPGLYSIDSKGDFSQAFDTGDKPVSSKAKVVSQPNPPRPPAPVRPSPVTWKDANGQEHYGWATPGQTTPPAEMKIPGATSIRGGNQTAPTKTNGTGIIPDALVKMWQDAQKVPAEKGGDQQRAIIKARIIRHPSLTPGTKSVLNAIVGNQNEELRNRLSAFSPSEIAAKFNANPTDATQIEEVLYILSGI